MGCFFRFSSLHPALYIELYMYLNFKAVLALPTHKSISFNWIVWSTLDVYLWHKYQPTQSEKSNYTWKIAPLKGKNVWPK